MGRTKKAYRGSPQEAAQSFLVEHANLLGFSAMKHLQYAETKRYKGTRYVTFNETVQDVPVYGAQYVVHLRANGQVNMVNGTYYPNIEISTTPSVSAPAAIGNAESDLDIAPKTELQTSSKRVIYREKEQFHLAWKLELSSQKEAIDWLYMVDAHSGNILKKLNLVKNYVDNKAGIYRAPRYGHKLLSNILTGDGDVYPTYPLSSSVTDEPLPRLNGNGYLDGKYVYVVNDKASRAYSSSESFQHASSNTHFDEVNLYYHVDRFRQNFIDQFGTDGDIGFTQVTVHAHSTQVDANAGFLAPNTLIFGDASLHPTYYDFAKSDQGIYHEYGHDVIYHIDSDLSQYGGSEKGAISEGTPDYWAGSYTGRSVNGDYVLAGNHPDILRDMADPTYSDYSNLPRDNYGNVSVDPHIGGEFFSSILWDIHNTVGAGETDELVYQTIDGISDNPTFLEFRDVIINEAGDDYSQQDANTIQNTFADHGVGGYVPPTVGINGPAGLFINQTGTFTANVSNGHPPYQNYKWYYDYNGNTMQLFAQGTATVQFTPTQTGSLHLQLIVTDSKDADGSGSKTVLVASHGGGF